MFVYVDIIWGCGPKYWYLINIYNALIILLRINFQFPVTSDLPLLDVRNIITINLRITAPMRMDWFQFILKHTENNYFFFSISMYIFSKYRSIDLYGHWLLHQPLLHTQMRAHAQSLAYAPSLIQSLSLIPTNTLSAAFSSYVTPTNI